MHQVLIEIPLIFCDAVRLLDDEAGGLKVEQMLS